MASFEGYMKDFDGARGEAQQALDTLAHCKDPQQREDRTVEARNCISEVERYIRILEHEAKQQSDARTKRQLENRVRHCETQHATLRSTLEKTILIGDARNKAAEAPASTAPKEQAVRCAEILDRNGRHLDEAQRTLAETEALAANTANNLLQQRNQLEHAQADVGQAQEDTDEAKTHLRRLTWKALTNKLLLWLIILILAAAIAVVSYYKWYPRTKKDVLGILPTPTPTPSASAGAVPSPSTSTAGG